MTKDVELVEVSLDYQCAFNSYISLKKLAGAEFGGDKPGQTKYRLCSIVARQLKEYAEEFEAVQHDLREEYGEEAFEREIKIDRHGNRCEGNYQLDPETKGKISIGKTVTPGSRNWSIFLKELREFGRKPIPAKIKIPEGGIELTTVGDPGSILEPLDWVLSDVIFEQKKGPDVDVLPTLKEIKDIMGKVVKKL